MRGDTVVYCLDKMIPGKNGKLSVRCKGLRSDCNNVVVLVQGANITGQAGYDLQVPEGEHYSFMDELFRKGVASVTFAVRGYGESELRGDPLLVQTDQAIEDLTSVVDWLKKEGFHKPHLLGWSWGGRIAGRFLENNSESVDRLILLDPAFGGGQLILPEPRDAWWDNTYDYFFNRLEAEFTELKTRKALAELVSSFEPKAPNGIRQENALGSTPLDPTVLTRPTLMLYGSAAGDAAYMKGSMLRGDFFEAVPSEDKALVVISGGGDYAHIQNPRQKFQHAVASFLLDN